MAYERELDAVQRWLDECDQIALAHFRIGVPFEEKPDRSPVTAADRGIEEAIRHAIERDFPGDAVLGEEQGSSRGDGTRRWIVDPIDATRNFRRGIPIFATLVALEEEGRPVLGGVSAPAIRTRWWASEGGGAWRNNEPIHVSEVAELARAEIASGGVDGLRQAGVLHGFSALCARAERHRGWGDFWGHMLVAQGSVEAMVDPRGLSVWDLAAPKVVVQEAGGRMTALDGSDRIDSGSALSTNAILHDEILALLRA